MVKCQGRIVMIAYMKVWLNIAAYGCSFCLFFSCFFLVLLQVVKIQANDFIIKCIPLTNYSGLLHSINIMEITLVSSELIAKMSLHLSCAIDKRSSKVNNEHSAASHFAKLIALNYAEYCVHFYNEYYFNMLISTLLSPLPKNSNCWWHLTFQI